MMTSLYELIRAILVFLRNTKSAILDFWIRGFGLKNFYALVGINHKDLVAASHFPNKP